MLKYQEELNKKEKSPKVKFEKKPAAQVEEKKTAVKGRSVSIKSENSNPEVINKAPNQEEEKLSTSPKVGFQISDFTDEYILQIPLHLNISQIEATERCYKPGPRSKIFMSLWIQKAFGNKLNETLGMLCTEVAAKYFVDVAKSKRKRCIVSAIVSAENYKF